MTSFQAKTTPTLCPALIPQYLTKLPTHLFATFAPISRAISPQLPIYFRPFIGVITLMTYNPIYICFLGPPCSECICFFSHKQNHPNLNPLTVEKNRFFLPLHIFSRVIFSRVSGGPSKRFSFFHRIGPKKSHRIPIAQEKIPSMVFSFC